MDYDLVFVFFSIFIISVTNNTNIVDFYRI